MFRTLSLYFSSVFGCNNVTILCAYLPVLYVLLSAINFANGYSGSAYNAHLCLSLDYRTLSDNTVDIAIATVTRQGQHKISFKIIL
jgi:hypothetical protein